MRLPIIVVDANILVSALLKNSTTREMLLLSKKPKLFAPEFIKQELLKYSNEFSKRLKVNESELKKFLNELFNAAKIEVTPKKEYTGFIEEAIKITPDPKDAPYFALALKLECPIWSQDTALKKQSKVKIFSTKELLEKFF